LCSVRLKIFNAQLPTGWRLSVERLQQINIVPLFSTNLRPTRIHLFEQTKGVFLTAFGPLIPAGWQLVGIEGVIYQGNSINRWQVYLYNPSTRQTAGWLVQLN
jgi:hypothetical protein